MFGDFLRASSAFFTIGATEAVGLGDAIEGAGDEISGKAAKKRMRAREATIRKQKAEAQQKKNDAVAKAYRQRRRSQGFVGEVNDASNILSSLSKSEASNSDSTLLNTSLLTKEK